MIFHWSRRNRECHQISRILISILADLHNTVVWMISTGPCIPKSSSPCTNPIVTVPNAPITIGITVTFMLHNSKVFSQGLGIYLSFHFPSGLPCDQPEWQSPLFVRYSFLLTITRSHRLTEIILSLCISIIMCFSFSRMYSVLCKYHLFDCQIQTPCAIPSGSSSPPSYV